MKQLRLDFMHGFSQILYTFDIKASLLLLLPPVLLPLHFHTRTKIRLRERNEITGRLGNESLRLEIH
ncbi:hypothetical protein SDJN02_07282, partial [Cucurbita argyrosperma subsp. argyrosperma]